MSTATKTHWKKLHNPDYIGAYSLMDGTDKPTDLTVQIQSVAVAEVKGADGKKDMCMVAQLLNQKPFIVNVTNAKTIEKMYGQYIEDWAGKKVTLFVAKIRVAGETIDALRIRPTVPKDTGKVKEELTPTHPKWNGAKDAILFQTTTLEKIKGAYTISQENEALLTAKDPTNEA